MAEPNEPKEFYAWAQFDEDCAKIAAWARERKFNSIYGIPRGGLVVAVKLSHLLEHFLKLEYPLTDPKIPIFLNKDDINSHTLAVSHSEDSGGAIERLKWSLGSYFSTAMIYKGKDSIVVPDCFLHTKESLVVFPWQAKQTGDINESELRTAIVCQTKTGPKEFFSWAQFDYDLLRLASWAESKNFSSLYGVPRGGLVVAVKMSYLLGIPVILSKDNITNSTLVVDDIADTGETVEKLKGSISSHFATATIYKAERSAVEPDFSLRAKNHWIVFPWETDETSRYDGTIF